MSPSRVGESTVGLFGDRRVLERVADAREDLIAERLVACRGKRCFRVAGVLLALAAKLLDQRIAVAFEAGVDVGRRASSLGRLGDRRVQLTLRGEAQRDRILRRYV